MIFSHGQVQTSEPINNVFELMQDICGEIGAKIRYIDKDNYQIIGKSKIIKRSILPFKFYIVLNKSAKGTVIEIFDESVKLIGPDKRFIEPLIATIAKRVPLTGSYIINKVNREKTKDDLIITNFIDDTSVQPSAILYKFTKLEYNVHSIDNSSPKDFHEVRKLVLHLDDNYEIRLIKDTKTQPVTIISLDDIIQAKLAAIETGKFRKERNLVLSITYSSVNADKSTSAVTPISTMDNQNNSRTVFLDMDDKDINMILDQINILKEVGRDDYSKLQFNAILKKIILCTYCNTNPSVFSFSFGQICSSCFTKDYGEIIIQAKDGEYCGGHKLYLAGGKFGDIEHGRMYLTSSCFIFNKVNKDQKKNWEIIIPLNSMEIDKWQIKEESRRKNIVLGGTGNDYGFLSSGIINESGRRHRFVLPYIDENGVSHSPVFGISSLSGDAIKEWVSKIYLALINVEKKVSEQPLINESKETKDSSIEDPLKIAKLRYARGEITKEEFEEMKKVLE
jgi:hypothetical protein